jgi:hypothetical protein
MKISGGPSSEAQPQTNARKWIRSSVAMEPAVLSASLWRPLRVRDDLQNGFIARKKEPLSENLT